MPLSPHFRLERLDRADLGSHDFLDLYLTIVKAILLCRERIRRLKYVRFDLIQVNGMLVDPAQGLVYALKLIAIDVQHRIVPDQVEHDLRHAARLSVLRALKDDVLHLAAAKAFGALFAEYPRHGI